MKGVACRLHQLCWNVLQAHTCTSMWEPKGLVLVVIGVGGATSLFGLAGLCSPASSVLVPAAGGATGALPAPGALFPDGAALLVAAAPGLAAVRADEVALSLSFSCRVWICFSRLLMSDCSARARCWRVWGSSSAVAKVWCCFFSASSRFFIWATWGELLPELLLLAPLLPGEVGGTCMQGISAKRAVDEGGGDGTAGKER